MQRRAFFQALGVAGLPEPTEIVAIDKAKGFAVTYPKGASKELIEQIRVAWQKEFPGVKLVIFGGASSIVRID